MRQILAVMGVLWAAMSPGAALAQGPGIVDTAPSAAPRIAGPQPLNPALLGLGLPASTAPALTPDTLPCPDCNPPKRFWLGVADLMLVQILPWSANLLIANQEWAEISPQTWRNNLAYPWQWDDNSFEINQFQHPYQGAFYFNSARTNGYDFWASAPWPVVGSLMWEYFFEAYPPAPNDLVNTSIGGIVLGETLYRLSRLTLDNTATGAERTWREIGSALLNPVSGFNRLVRGETGRVSANPPQWRPSAILGVMDLGYRRTVQSIGSGNIETGSNQWNASFLLSYGDPAKDLSRSPFSYFSLRADLAGPSNEGLVNQISARGSLTAWPLDARGRHQVAASLEYDYFNNPAFEYGGQSVQLGLVSNIGAPGKVWWGQTSFLFNGVLLGAAKSDYFQSTGARNYDYGPGLGTILSGRILYRNRLQGTVGYTGLWIHTVDGTQSAHYQDALLIEARYWATRKVGVGLSYAGYTRHSDYRDLPDVDQDARFVRFFISQAIPGLPNGAHHE